MYIAIAILAAIFAANTPAKSEKSSAIHIPAGHQAILPPKETPTLIDARFHSKSAPWEKNTDPAEFLPSSRTC